MPTVTVSPRRIAVILFLGVTLAYILWRAPGDLIWDDSPTICADRYPQLGARATGPAASTAFSIIVREEFSTVRIDGFRPLSWTVRRLALACYAVTPAAAPAFLVLNGLLAGALAVALFLLARRFTRTTAGALAAVFLFLASTPVLTGFLVLFTGIQALVPLAMCLALHCYFRSLESPRHGWWLFALGVILFVAPWYREFAGLTPLLVLALELLAGRWRSGPVLVAGLAFAQALFPTALLHFAFFPELPLGPVYRLGVLGEQVRAGVNADATLLTRLVEFIAALKWRVFLDLVSILPPTLFLLAAVGWLLIAVRRRALALPGKATAFLLFFFALTFLPFLKVFKEHVHLAYCLVPASIFLAASAEALWAEAALLPRGPRRLIAALLLVVIADHGLNPLVVRGATRDCYAAIARVADFCRREMPEGAALLSNAHHAADVRWQCDGRFSLYYTTMTSGEKDLIVGDVRALKTVRQRAGDRGLYLLDVRLPRRKGQPGADRGHWVVREQPVAWVDYGEIDLVSYRYPVIDPLKLLLPIRNSTWPNSPDLEFDYYRGPALNRVPFLREVAVRYHFYRVLGPRDGSASENAP